MLLAAIDVGSNAVRLLFSNVIERDGHPVADKASLVRIPVRLGEDVFKDGFVSDERSERLIKTLKAFSLLIDVYKPIQYRACATAAMREASNCETLLKKIKKETNLDVNVIDGLEEARIVAAVNNISIGKQYKYKMYVDVGGGSTEISITKDTKLIQSESFKIGTIRIRENMTEESEWIRMKEWLKPWREEEGRVYCIGSGGNINKIAKLYAKIDPTVLYYKELEEAYDALSKVSLEYRVTQLGLRPDRADVIVPAMEVFIKIMKWARAEFAYVPKIGLPDGLVYLLYKEIMTGIPML